MDRPAVLVGVLLDQRMREHRQHELTLDRGKSPEQGLEVRVIERSVVMTAVGPDIGRIHEVERIRAVVALDDMGAVLGDDVEIVEGDEKLIELRLLAGPFER